MYTKLYKPLRTRKYVKNYLIMLILLYIKIIKVEELQFVSLINSPKAIQQSDVV